MVSVSAFGQAGEGPERKTYVLGPDDQLTVRVLDLNEFYGGEFRSDIGVGIGLGNVPPHQSSSAASSVLGRGGGVGRRQQVPDPGGWGSPIELTPDIHCKTVALLPGYMPGYPVPPGQGSAPEDHGPGLIEY